MWLKHNGISWFIWKKSSLTVGKDSFISLVGTGAGVPGNTINIHLAHLRHAHKRRVASLCYINIRIFKREDERRYNNNCSRYGRNAFFSFFFSFFPLFSFFACILYILSLSLLLIYFLPSFLSLTIVIHNSALDHLSQIFLVSSLG